MKKTTKKTKRTYMPRLPRDEVAKREDFMKTLFRKEPDLSQPKATAAFQAQFGSKMRPQRVYALRKLVRDEIAATAAAAPPKLLRKLGPGFVQVASGDDGVVKEHHLVATSRGSEDLAEEIVNKLIVEGLVHVRVVGKGAGFVVLETVK